MARDSVLLNVNNNDAFLKGSLSLTNITDLLQFLSASYKSGMIQLIRQPGDKEGKIFFKTGEIVNVLSGKTSGLEGFADLLSWDQGTFQFHPDVTAPEKNIGLPVQHAIIQAAVLLANGRVLIAGGQGSETEFLLSSELFDPAHATFSATGQMNNVHAGATATVLENGNALIAGGRSNWADLYNTAAGTFLPTGRMVTDVAESTSTLIR